MLTVHWSHVYSAWVTCLQCTGGIVTMHGSHAYNAWVAWIQCMGRMLTVHGAPAYSAWVACLQCMGHMLTVQIYQWGLPARNVAFPGCPAKLYWRYGGHQINSRTLQPKTINVFKRYCSAMTLLIKSVEGRPRVRSPRVDARGPGARGTRCLVRGPRQCWVLYLSWIYISEHSIQ